METNEVSDLDVAKAGHRAMWGLGDYARVADTVIPKLGKILVDASTIDPDAHVLDVAAGTGNASLPAARRGANVTATDLNGHLLAECHRRAEAEGLRIECTPADAESLPFPDQAFDAVLSCVGAMFAPDHQQVAAELIRVTRPGGTIAMINWTPDGFVGQLFATMTPFVPPPAPGSQPPPRWGDEEHVRTLLSGHVTDLTLNRGEYPVSAFPTGAAFRDFFKSNYGPTVAVYQRLSPDADRVAQLDGALAELADRHLDNGVMGWGYLLVLARKLST